MKKSKVNSKEKKKKVGGRPSIWKCGAANTMIRIPECLKVEALKLLHDLDNKLHSGASSDRIN